MLSRADVRESGTLPYLTRKQTDGSIAIVTRATRLPTGVYPYRRADEAFAIFKAAYPAIERLTDGLDGALMNAGPIIHPADPDERRPHPALRPLGHSQ